MAPPKANPSWFAFPLTPREGLERSPLIAFLEGRKIETRLLFAGNAARQPAFRGEPIRAPFPLKVFDAVPERSFFVGIFPGLTDPMPDDMIESFRRPARAERRRPFRIARTRSPGS